MGEMAEVFNAMNEMKKERHSNWHDVNTSIIKDSGIEYKEASRECYIVRTNGIKADFYPSTGRWRDIWTGRTHRGGALDFCLWVRRNEN